MRERAARELDCSEGPLAHHCGDSTLAPAKFRPATPASCRLQALGLAEQLKHTRVLHIAGTKGKGSTAAFAASILRACGYSVGLFTSPHLCDVRERIRIDGCAPRPRARLCWGAAG